MNERNLSQPVACHATARGIIQCLRMLAEEASSLELTFTVRALRSAIGICEFESCASPALQPSEPIPGSIAFLHRAVRPVASAAAQPVQTSDSSPSERKLARIRPRRLGASMKARISATSESSP